MGAQESATRSEQEEANIRLEVFCSATLLGDALVLVGAVPEIGEWNVESGVQLETNASMFPKWIAFTRPLPAGTEFKIVIIGPSGIRWEPLDQNRRWPADAAGNSGNGAVVCISFGHALINSALTPRSVRFKPSVSVCTCENLRDLTIAEQSEIWCNKADYKAFIRDMLYIVKTYTVAGNEIGCSWRAVPRGRVLAMKHSSRRGIFIDRQKAISFRRRLHGDSIRREMYGQRAAGVDIDWDSVAMVSCASSEKDRQLALVQAGQDRDDLHRSPTVWEIAPTIPPLVKIQPKVLEGSKSEKSLQACGLTSTNSETLIVPRDDTEEQDGDKLDLLQRDKNPVTKDAVGISLEEYTQAADDLQTETSGAIIDENVASLSSSDSD